MTKLDQIQSLVRNDLRIFRQDYFGNLEKIHYTGNNPILGEIKEDRYQVPSLNFFDNFKCGGIIGGEKPSDYAASIQLWNTLFQSQKIKAVFFGLDLEPVRDETGKISKIQPQFDSLLNAASKSQFYELTITDPYKEVAYDYVKKYGKIDEAVNIIGAINHIVFGKDGAIYGYNTDGYGMVRSMKQEISLIDKKVLLIGAGGSGKAIGYETITNGIGEEGQLIIANRTAEKGAELANIFNIRVKPPVPVKSISLEILDSYASKVDVIVQAVTTGEPITTKLAQDLNKDILFVDTRYGAKASFARIGKETGHPTLEGKGMLYWQFDKAASKVKEHALQELDLSYLSQVAKVFGYVPKEEIGNAAKTS